MERLTRQLIQKSYPVIIDSSALRISERTRFLLPASQLNVPKRIIECIAKEKDLEQRLRLRRSQNDEPLEATVETLQHQKKWSEPLTKQEQK
ncbi:MAG: AAA family ATPase [Endozoicomonas sp.]